MRKTILFLFVLLLAIAPVAAFGATASHATAHNDHSLLWVLVSSVALAGMAKIQFGAAVADARGKFAGQVFSKSRFGSYIRRKSSPVQPRTSAQTAVRASFTDFSKRWANSITDVQRAAWRALAAANPVRNVFGQAITLTGLQLYQSVNRNLASAGQPSIDDAPLNLSVSSPGAIVVAQHAITGDFDLTPAVDSAAGETVLVLAAGPLNAGREFIGSNLRILHVAAGAAAAYHITKAVYEARFGTLQADQKIFLGLAYVSNTTGGRSSTAQNSLIRT